MMVALHRSSKSDGWSARRQERAAGCHFHTAAFVEGFDVERDTSDSIPWLFQNSSRSSGWQFPTRVTGLLKDLLDTVLEPRASISLYGTPLFIV